MFTRCILFSCIACMMNAGCSSTNCCNWWGRNSDSSTNLGRKPTPVQQGPIAGTYSRPGNTATPMMPPSTISSPSSTGTNLPQDSSSPLLTPPSPPQNVTPTQHQYQGNVGTLPLQLLPPAGLTQLPDNRPSISQPTMPAMQVQMPQVQAPPVDMTLPNAGASVPLMMAPSNKEPAVLGTGVAPPAVDLPAIAPPSINLPMDVSPPKASNMPGKLPSMNPGTTPPPLPANPVPPQFDKK